MSPVVPLQAEIRIRSLLELEGSIVISYQIPGRVTVTLVTSRRKHVSSPRGSSVAPCVEVKMVSPTAKGKELGQLSFRGGVNVGEGEMEKFVVGAIVVVLLGANVGAVAVADVGASVVVPLLGANVGVPVVTLLSAKDGAEVVTFVGTVVPVGAVVTIVGKDVDGSMVRVIVVGTKVGVSVAGASVG